MIRLAINGYGRIGRLAHRVILEKYSSEIDVVAINTSSSTDLKGWMLLLKYDTVYGVLPFSVILSSSQDLDSDLRQNDNGKIGSFTIDGKDVVVFSEKDPAKLPWKLLGVDVVIESSGAFRKEEDLKKHLDAGAKAVVLSAPAKDPSTGHSTVSSGRIGSGQVPTYVLSVNQQNYKGEKIISNASCTTNCITPVAKIIQDNFGIEKAMMTTIHGYTSDQRLQDAGHKDYRRARAASQNIVPTSTGATEAAAKALPELLGKFTGLAIRVPVISGSLSDFTFLVQKKTTINEVNEVFKKEAQNPQYKGILEVTEDPIVSSDIIGSSASAIVDLSLTQVVSGDLVKVVAWYDNEWGYANRLVEETMMIGSSLSS